MTVSDVGVRAHHVTDECVRDCVWMVCVRVWIRICVRASYCAWALLSVECMCASLYVRETL